MWTIYGLNDVKVRVFELSIQMALKYYQYDLDYLQKRKLQYEDFSFGHFGIQYAKFLSNINKSILNATVQFQIQKTILEWLQ